jgi:heme/copper-type cytochrome/quinol oxidase subunit 2
MLTDIQMMLNTQNIKDSIKQYKIMNHLKGILILSLIAIVGQIIGYLIPVIVFTIIIYFIFSSSFKQHESNESFKKR